MLSGPTTVTTTAVATTTRPIATSAFVAAHEPSV